MTESAIIPRAPLASGKRVLDLRRPAVRDAIPVSAPIAVLEIQPAAASDAAVEAERRERDIAEAVAAARAELEAQHLRHEAEELEREREEARADGLREGREAALEEARAERHADSERLRTVFAAVDESHARMLDRSEETAVAIGFAAACKILGESLVTREGVRAAVLAVLGQARAVEHAVIRLHPDDVERLGALEEAGVPLAGARVVADASVGVGSCSIDTSAGTLESRLEARVVEMREALLQAHRAPAEEGA